MDGGNVYDDIVNALEQNGSMTAKEQTKLMLLALNDIGRRLTRVASDVQAVETKVDTALKRIDRVESESIVRWLKKNPKYSVPMGGAAITFFATLVGHLGLWGWLLRVIGVPVP